MIRIACIVASVAALTSCGGSTEPRSSMTLAFDPRSATATGQLAESGTFATCPFAIAVKAVGGAPGDTVTLLSITNHFYTSAGPSNTTNANPFDWFGETRLAYSGTLTAQRTAGGTPPFSVMTLLSYVDRRGRTGVDSLTLTCL